MVWQKTMLNDPDFDIFFVDDTSIVNYEETGQHKRRSVGGPAMFDPFYFDLDYFKERLKESLGSNLRPQQPGGSKMRRSLHPNHQDSYKPGCVRMEVGDGLVEVVNLRRDQKDLALCANCGLTKDLLMCKRCKQVYYCSVECQQKHWNLQHGEECTKMREIHKQYKKDDEELLKDETSASSDGKCELVMDICSKNCMPFYVMENASVSKLKEKFIKAGFYFHNKDTIEVIKMHLSSEPVKELVECREYLGKWLKEGKL